MGNCTSSIRKKWLLSPPNGTMLRTLQERFPMRRIQLRLTRQYRPCPTTAWTYICRDVGQSMISMFGSQVVDGSPGTLRVDTWTAPESNVSASDAIQTLLTTFTLYCSRPPSNPSARNQYEKMRKDCIDKLSQIMMPYFGTVLSLAGASTATEDQETSTSSEASHTANLQAIVDRVSLVSLLVQLYKGKEMASVFDFIAPEAEESSGESSEVGWLKAKLKELKRIAEFQSLIYSDPCGMPRFIVAQYEELRNFFQTNGQDFWAALQRCTEQMLDDFEEDLPPSAEFVRKGLSFFKRAVGFLATSTGRKMLDMILLGGQIAARVQISQVERGVRYRLLPQLETYGPGFQREPGENGYTRVFIGGRKYRISRLQKEFLRRNTALDPTAVEMDVVTIAVSYKHFWQNPKLRISRPDFEAIASFIEASHGTRVRFWVDSKLPPTNDGSFERWLTRGVRPYARYLTLACPSAYASLDRFWIAMERNIGIAGKGVFYCRGNDILFQKGIHDFKKLAKQLLQIIIGDEKLPSGVNAEDEGKVCQWALGALGSPENDGDNPEGPKVDQLYFPDFVENKAIRRVQDVIKEHGPFTLPLIPGRMWNKHNPLMKGSDDQQRHKMVAWIGLVHPDKKKSIYFLHSFLFCDLNKPSVVVLRVRLRKPYDEQDGNCIEEKVLMMIESAALRKMHPVTVPATCEWEVFSDTQKTDGCASVIVTA